MVQSSDPDADAVLASFDHPEAQHDADAAAVLQSFDQPAVPKSGQEVVKDVIHANVSRRIAAVGAGLRETGDLLTGSSIADAHKRYDQFVQEHSFHPTDPISQALVQANQQAESSPLNPMTWPGQVVDTTGQLINAAADPRNAVGSNPLLAAKTGLPQYAPNPNPLPTTGGPTDLGPIVAGAASALPLLSMRGTGRAPIDAQTALDTAASKQSMGAAAAAPRITSLSPQLQQAVKNAAQKTGGAVPPEVLARHVEADSLPVKMQLTEGQATQDPQTISQEMNTRGRTPEMVARLNQQNQQLAENVQALRDRVGPEVFSTNPVEHGDTLIQAYKDKDAPIKADITAKYKALEDANGGHFPLDTDSFVKATDAALSKAFKSNSVPSDLAANLNELRNGRQMTFEDFESLRSDAADAARTSTDGRQRAAAGIIRDQLENMPLTSETAKLKPLADVARSAAKARFDALDADPAYEAAVHGTVPPDQFVRKFVIGPSATRDGVARMQQFLGDNETAKQTMAVAALDHLRDSAGVGPGGSGNFSQAGFNKHLTALEPKLASLVDPKTSEDLSTLGNVARYTQNQPRGSFVNNSNTLVASLAEHGKSLAEGVANKVLGFGGVIPVGTLARQAAQRQAASRAAAKSLAPGAGLTRLPDTKQ